jgi:hypothetical protein
MSLFSGNVKQVLKAIADGADLDAVDKFDFDMTPLMHICSDFGRPTAEIISMLIQAGANVNYVRESDEMTALKFAADECPGACVEKQKARRRNRLRACVIHSCAAIKQRV